MSSDDPMVTCAEVCMREKVCSAFLYQNSSYECKWTNHDTIERGLIAFPGRDVTMTSSYLKRRFSFYEKNITKVNKA